MALAFVLGGAGLGALKASSPRAACGSRPGNHTPGRRGTSRVLNGARVFAIVIETAGSAARCPDGLPAELRPALLDTVSRRACANQPRADHDREAFRRR
ncbi:hypothetical protein HBB16_07915 [Pseudonocardia sp. MCCB 268]|nr:hypothetical protein [Pseudonocardia cytotoxica]